MAKPSRAVRRQALGIPVPRADHLGTLDGLRAVAVVAVVAYHLGHLRGGFLGVDVFFVLSGFLITRLLLAERENSGGIGLRAFWRRRLRRLVPPLLVVLPAVAIGARLWLPSWRLADVRTDALAALGYVANWRMVQSGQSYFGQGMDPSPLRHTWSLGVEEQFYLLWPVLVLLAVRLVPGSVRGLVLVGSASLAVTSAAWMAWTSSGVLDLSRVYYGTDTRVFAMCAGAVVASFWDPWREWAGATDEGRRTVSWVTRMAHGALIGVVVLFVVGSDSDPGFYRWGFQLAAVLSAVAITGLALGRGPVAGALNRGLPRWVGRRSYGIYLWSWPMQVFARTRLVDHRGLALDLAIVATSVGLAALSFRYVEQPILTGRPVWRRGAVRATGSSGRRLPLRGLRPVSAVVGVVSLLVVTTHGATGSPTVFSVSDSEARAVALRDDGFATSRAPASVRPPRSTSTTVVAPPGAGQEVNGEIVDQPTTPADARDPGPAPPFDPAVSLVVQSADGDPAAVHGRPLRVVLLGDSVAWTLGWSMEGGLDPGIELSTRAIIGCGMMPIDAAWGAAGSDMQDYGSLCAEQAEAERKGYADEPDLILLWMGAWEVFDHVWQGEELKVGSQRYAEVLEGRIQERIDRAREIGVPVVVAVVPCMGEVPAGTFDGVRREEDRVRWVNDRIRKVALRNPGWVRMVDPTSQLCDSSGQPIETTAHGVEIRPDGVHFEVDSAMWLWNTWLTRALASAFDPAP